MRVGVPLELPPEPVHFVNRDTERTQVREAVLGRANGTRPPVLSLHGPGGLGKTELAALLARTLADSHPDGVLLADLDDYRVDGVLDPADVLAQLLDSLGVEPALLAPDFKGRCRQFRTKTSRAALVLLLDNARYASEVAPLLPASADSLVIVTSHGPLYDLADGAALDLALTPLTREHARELFQLLVDDRRLAADPQAVEDMLRLCAGLPAAVQVAGRWVRRHPLRPLPRLLAEFRAELHEKGVPEVEQLWDTAYRGLTPPAAALYRLLPHHPGPSFTRRSATALLGRGPQECDTALEELAEAGLIDVRTAGTLDAEGPLRLPGPLHAHALRRARQQTTAEEIANAQQRVVSWCLRQSQLADRYLAGPRLTVTERLPALPDTPDAPLDDPEHAASDEERAERVAHAARWLHGQRHLLYGCVRLAHARGLDAEVVALCEPLWTHALHHPHRSETVEAMRLGVASAQRAAYAPWLVRMHCQLARPLWESDRITEAQQEIDAALAAVRLLDGSERDRKLAASAVEFRGMVHSARGDWATAAQDFAHCRELHRAIPNPYGVLLQTYRLGEALARLGDLEEARALLHEAHTLAADQRRTRLTGRTGLALGGVLHRLGRTEEAQPLYKAALTTARALDSGADQARILDALAELTEARGEFTAAAEYRTAAAEIRHSNGLA
ncbi:hypothetical protein [Streptomyces sp. NPDC058045]|uniref:hypothetical protein n=1 Tax=Streptomyces sp. NPDC058045 TaxID=3346311 RepID=UPI0036E630F3